MQHPLLASNDEEGMSLFESYEEEFLAVSKSVTNHISKAEYEGGNGLRDAEEACREAESLLKQMEIEAR